MKHFFILLVIVCFSCSSTTNNNKDESVVINNPNEEGNVFDTLSINKSLVREFHFDSLVYPGNPDLEYELVKTHSYDLNNDGTNDTIQNYTGFIS